MYIHSAMLVLIYAIKYFAYAKVVNVKPGLVIPHKEEKLLRKLLP